MDVKETLELDIKSYKRVQAMAKDEKRTLENEAAYLLEKGILIAETVETQKQTDSP